MLNCLRFLTAEEQQDDSHDEKSLKAVENMLDQVYPNWRNCAIGNRIIGLGVPGYTSAWSVAKRICDLRN